MGYDNVDIAFFNGMVGSVDERDLPAGTAVYARNIDMATYAGLFRGLPEDVPSAIDTNGQVFTKFQDGTHAAYFDEIASGGEVRVLSGLASGGNPFIATTPRVAAPSQANGQRSGASDGDAVHMGLGASEAARPMWCGSLYHEQFNESAQPIPVPVGFSAFTAELETIGVGVGEEDGFNDRILPDLEDGESVASQVYFEKGSTYYYYASLMYDGRQESPLQWLKTAYISSIEPGISQHDGYRQLNQRIRAYTGPAGGEFPRRVTGIKIYRSEGTGAHDPDTPVVEGTPFLVKFIDINDPDWVYDGEWPDTMLEGYEYVLEDTGEAHGSFEAETDYAATLEHMQVHYGLSCIAGGYHIVGDCWHKDLKDTETWLFRSKSFLFDTFDWSQDWLNLSAKPRALVSWQGRVYAFMEGYTLVINAETFDIEDTWEGISTHSRQSVVTTDAGMFWTDINNIYIHEGARHRPIGQAVLHNPHTAVAAWLNHNPLANPIVSYHPRYSSFIIVYNAAASWQALMFHAPTSRWVHLSIVLPVGSTDVLGMISMGDGVPLIATSAGLLSQFSASDLRGWEFVGQQMKSIGARHKHYFAYVETRLGFPVDGSNFIYYENDPNYTTPVNWTDVTTIEDPSTEDVILKGKINTGAGPPFNQVRSFAVEVSGSGADDVSHISLVRRVQGVR